MKAKRKDIPFVWSIKAENKKIMFEIDNSRRSAVSKQFYDTNLSHLPIIKKIKKIRFRLYSGDKKPSSARSILRNIWSQKRSPQKRSPNGERRILYFSISVAQKNGSIRQNSQLERNQ